MNPSTKNLIRAVSFAVLVSLIVGVLSYNALLSKNFKKQKTNFSVEK